MATTKSRYDPIKSIEGMFNGSVTRIGYMLKDPLNYGSDTKAVLEECSKRFQDALDDCEIQILDAKWYLEYQLAQNRAKREATAREASAASTKRKHSEIEQTEVLQDRDEAAKRTKVESENPREGKTLQTPSKQSQPVATAPQIPSIFDADASSKPKIDQRTPIKTIDTPEAKPVITAPKVQVNTSEGKSDVPQADVPPLSGVEEFTKSTQATPAPTNDDFNFTSMFGEPSGDGIDGTGNDMDFDLGLGDDFTASLNNTNNTNLDGSTSLNSLLPGLETYANQAGDDGNVFSTDDNNNNPPAMNNFDLPDLGTNDFDDFLNANDFSNTNFNNNVNLGEDDLLNMENMDGMENIENIDFDSMFK